MANADDVAGELKVWHLRTGSLPHDVDVADAKASLDVPRMTTSPEPPAGLLADAT